MIKGFQNLVKLTGDFWLSLGDLRSLLHPAHTYTCIHTHTPSLSELCSVSTSGTLISIIISLSFVSPMRVSTLNLSLPSPF